MDRSKQSGTFVGTVDQLLNHCSKLDIEQLYVDCEKRECIDVIVKEMNCSVEEAQIIYNEFALEEVKDAVNQLINEGLMKISGYNEDGEPLFVLTELGKKVQEELINQKDNN